jgi:hypothetical protein
MNDERLDVAGAQPARQPKTVATRFVGDHNPLNRAASLDCFLAPAMQQSEQRVWVNVQFLQRMPFHARHDSRNEPTRQTHLDNRNEGVALLERGDRAAQIVCLQHGCLHELVSCGLSRCRRTPHSIFRRLLDWLALLLSAILAALTAAADHKTPLTAA